MKLKTKREKDHYKITIDLKPGETFELVTNLVPPNISEVKDVLNKEDLEDWGRYFIEDYCRIYRGNLIPLNDAVESIFLTTGVRKIGRVALCRLQALYSNIFTITRPAAKKGKSRIYYVNIAK